MTFSESDWTQFLLKSGVLKFGSFQLKDGSISPFFLDFGSLSRGSEFRELGRFFYQKIHQTLGFDQVDFLYGPPYKATMMAVALASACTEKDLSCYFSRKEAKGHGEGGTSFGYRTQPTDSYLVLDDVMSSGQTKIEALQELQPCQCLAVVVGVDRQHSESGTTAAQRFTQQTGVPVVSLVDLSTLAALLEGHLPEQQQRALLEYINR